ncbi:MAG: WG repeat-containing protein [Prevotellaceae bacterium]|jgi:hypothetical protein|nr:WG repeat-containing protein [Prevotellaceae bacterium]
MNLTGKEVKTVYLVINDSYRSGSTEEFVGIYSDKERAIKVAKKEWNEYGKWQRRLAVPMALYLNHYDDLKMKCLREDKNFEFDDYLGYTGQEWQSTIDVIQDYGCINNARGRDGISYWAECRHDYSRTQVLQYNLDKKDADPETVWEKKWKDTNLIPCRENGKWGFRDEATNKFVVSPTYDDCIQFQSKWAYWEEWGKDYGYQISKKPRKVDYWGIKSADNGKWGVVNENGQLIIPAEYDEICNEIFKGMQFLYFFKISKNGKYGLLNKHGRTILPIEYDGDLQYHIERERGVTYVSAQRNGKQEHCIISEDYPEDRQKMLDSWFEWTKEAAQAVVRLNRALIEAEENVRKEYNARKAKLKSRLAKNDKFLTDYEIGKALKLSIRIGNENSELTDPTGFIIDGEEKDWSFTFGEDAVRHLQNEMPNELRFIYGYKIHYGIHVLRNHLLLAWEDILKIHSVWAEVRVDYQKNIDIPFSKP